MLYSGQNCPSLSTIQSRLLSAVRSGFTTNHNYSRLILTKSFTSLTNLQIHRCSPAQIINNPKQLAFIASYASFLLTNSEAILAHTSVEVAPWTPPPFPSPPAVPSGQTFSWTAPCVNIVPWHVCSDYPLTIVSVNFKWKIKWCWSSLKCLALW